MTPYRDPPCPCKSITFEPEKAQGLDAYEVRKRWPRWYGKCSCGYDGILYASYEHYIYGDW